MKQVVIQTQQKQEGMDAVKQFAALSPDKQEMAILIMRGIQIGEDIAARTVRPNL